MPLVNQPSKKSPPKLVNRGAAGLLTRVPSKNGEVIVHGNPELWASAKKNNVLCEGTVVAISSLKPDPNNAREHGERNLAAIKDSLCLYGQRTPLVVRKQNRMVAAGNGRLKAAVELGWTKIAISARPMTDVEFAGYGLADNRTAELARWNFEVVARLDELLAEALVAPVGWSMEELTVLRKSDWQTPVGENGEAISGTNPLQRSEIDSMWNVLVTCKDEKAQGKLLEELTERGYECRALIL